jgi:hypothetical protein
VKEWEPLYASAVVQPQTGGPWRILFGGAVRGVLSDDKYELFEGIDLICGTNYSNSSSRGFITNLTTARWWGRNPNLGLKKYFIGTLSLAPLFNPTSEDSS